MKRQCPGANILLIASSACEIDAVKSEINMGNFFQDISKKQIQEQLMAVPYKQPLLQNEYMEEKYFKFFLRKNIIVNR